MTIGAAALATLSLRQTVEQGDRRELRAIGTALATEMSRYGQGISLTLQRVQEHVDHAQVTTPGTFARLMSSRETFAFLARARGYLPSSDVLALLDSSGDLVNFTRAYPPPNAVNVAHRDYFRSVRDHAGSALFFGRPVLSRAFEVPAIIAARRLNAPDGSFLGVAVAKMSIQELRTLFGSVAALPGQTAALIRRNGVRLVTWPPTPHAARIMPITSPWYRTVAAGGGLYRTADGLSFVAPLRHYPLVVKVSLPDSAALVAWRQQATVIWVSTLLVASAISLLFHVIVRQIRNLDDRNAELDQAARKLRRSEGQMLDFVRTASDWFWDLDADLNFIPVGIEPSGIGTVFPSHAGMRFWDVFDPDPDPKESERHCSVLMARQPFRDFPCLRTDAEGRVRHLSASGIPVYDEAGVFTGYRGTTRDISTEKAAEAELRAAKERAEHAETLLEDAVNAITEGFVILDRDDRFVMYNEGYLATYAALRDLIVPGATFESILRVGLARGAFLDAAGQENEWLAERLRHHRTAAGAFEQKMAGGRTVLNTERRMRDGGIAGLRIDITELKQAQDALRASEERLDRAQEIAGIGSWEIDSATGRSTWSKQMYRMIGLEEGGFEPTPESLAHYTDDADLIRDWLTGLAQERTQGALEYSMTLPTGRTRLVRNAGRAIVDPDGAVRRLAGTVQDITDQRDLQRQLVQAQKMEAIGNLTGGIAHDFNNAIGVIVGNMQLLLEQIAGDQSARELCEDALAAGRRAAELTHRLLAFARRQPLHPRSTDINHLMGETVRLLRRVLQANIEIVFDPAPELPPIAIDSAQLEAAITNLAANAVDAMPLGGRLRIATEVAMLDPGYATLPPEVVPGRYTRIIVSDTGAGMPPEVTEHVFEPFFTTKSPGQGTGLGLSMVFGFIKQSSGHITVDSEPGHGTTFRLYLPSRTGGGPESHAAPEGGVGGDDRTVLLVDDDPLLRRSIMRQLTELGYAVTTAESAEAALSLLDSGPPIRLLLTDVVMPGAIDGIGLAEQVRLGYPGIRVLLMSGFPDLRATGHVGSPPRFPLLSKPFGRDQLAAAIRAVRDPPPAAGAPSHAVPAEAHDAE